MPGGRPPCPSDPSVAVASASFWMPSRTVELALVEREPVAVEQFLRDVLDGSDGPTGADDHHLPGGDIQRAAGTAGGHEPLGDRDRRGTFVHDHRVTVPGTDAVAVGVSISKRLSASVRSVTRLYELPAVCPPRITFDSAGFRSVSSVTSENIAP